MKLSVYRPDGLPDVAQREISPLPGIELLILQVGGKRLQH